MRRVTAPWALTHEKGHITARCCDRSESLILNLSANRNLRSVADGLCAHDIHKNRRANRRDDSASGASGASSALRASVLVTSNFPRRILQCEGNSSKRASIAPLRVSPAALLFLDIRNREALEFLEAREALEGGLHEVPLLALVHPKTPRRTRRRVPPDVPAVGKTRAEEKDGHRLSLNLSRGSICFARRNKCCRIQGPHSRVGPLPLRRRRKARAEAGTTSSTWSTSARHRGATYDQAPRQKRFVEGQKRMSHLFFKHHVMQCEKVGRISGVSGFTSAPRPRPTHSLTHC